MVKAAHSYVDLGWTPIPLTSPYDDQPSAGKRPVSSQWQKATPPPHDEIDDLFAEPRNIGVLLGKPSGGLVDVDLDCAEALALADEFLPSTGLVSGRASTPRSHRWYVVDSDERTKKFASEDLGVIVELRGNGGQTVVPPSLHAKSGEEVRWEPWGQPAPVAYDDLLDAVTKLAIASRLVQTGASRDDAVALAENPAVNDSTDEAIRSWLKGPAPARQHRESSFTKAVCDACSPADVLTMLGYPNVGKRMDCVFVDHSSRGSMELYETGYSCFACREKTGDGGGNSIKLYAKLENIPYGAARLKLAKLRGIVSQPRYVPPPPPKQAQQLPPQQQDDHPADEVVYPDYLTEMNLVDVAMLAVDQHSRAKKGDLGKRIYTGLVGIDALFGGFRPRDITVLGARTGVGKSNLLLRMLLGAANSGSRVGMVSLELTHEEVSTAITAIHGRLRRSEIDNGKLPTPGRLLDVVEEFSVFPGGVRFMRASKSLTATELMDTCFAMHRKSPLDLIGIDYLQRIVVEPREDIVAALRSLTMKMRDFSNATDCHVLATAQLNRGPEHRGENAKPRESDIKGSGQIEQEANNVILLHRPNKDSRTDSKPDDFAFLYVTKNRRGRDGRVRVGWDANTVSFYNVHN